MVYKAVQLTWMIWWCTVTPGILTFQWLINRVVDGLEGCSVYLDDLMVYSDTWHSHVHRIHKLFEWLRLWLWHS